MVDPLNLQVIRQAQAGHEQSLTALAEQVRPKVHTYTYRLTLDYHLAQDLTQETVLEMIQALPRLDLSHENFFWAWVFRTALGKVQHHFRPRGARRLALKTTHSKAALDSQASDQGSADKIAIREELRNAVVSAMKALRLRYRNILVLRCYNNLSYHEIAAILGGSELQARLLFFRAKRSLKSQLETHGLKRDSLLGGLSLFGTVTVGAGKQAAAAEVVPAACLETGWGVGLVGLCTGKIALMAVSILLLVGVTVKLMLPSHAEELSPGTPATHERLLSLLNSAAFAYPSQIVRTYAPGRSDFRAIDLALPENRARPIQPEEILVHTPKEKRLGLIIPPEHWVEVAFDAPVRDGPGPDILLTGWGCRFIRVFVTDGADQVYELPGPKCLHYCWGHHVLDVDLAGQDPPFIPKAVRILGATGRGRQGGFELTAVKARIH